MVAGTDRAIRPSEGNEGTDRVAPTGPGPRPRATPGGRRTGAGVGLRRQCSHPPPAHCPATRPSLSGSAAGRRAISLRATAADGDRLRSSPRGRQVGSSGPGGGMMGEPLAVLQASAIKQHCKLLHLPTIGGQSVPLAEQAEREHQGYLGYLDVLLQAELEEREQNTVTRRIKEAHLPKVKTLEEFDFQQARAISATKMRELAEGGYIERAEPVVLIGECGTGKTHLLSGLCVAACRQKRRVRFTTAAGLVNELVEAKQQVELRRVLARWERNEVIAIDEVGYVPLAEVGAELLFQVVADRAEKAALILTTNLPFSEWTQVIPNARLCKALLDRITDRAHIIETGTESSRFRRTAENRPRPAQSGDTKGS